MYHCAQLRTRQQMPKKSQREGVKQRDKEQMESFPCGGWMHITITEGDPSAFVRFKHQDDHVHYWNIDIPSDIKSYVQENMSMNPTQVSLIMLVKVYLSNIIVIKLWDAILQKYPKPSFSRKQIYTLWHNHNSQQWKRDENKVISARILIEEASKKGPGPGGMYKVTPIPLNEETGFTAIAFSLPEMLRKWGGTIREISLDSACQFFKIFECY